MVPVTAVALIASSVVVTSTSAAVAAAGPPKPPLPTVSQEWHAPGTVNRTPVGGPPPATPWRPGVAGRPQTTSKAAGLADCGNQTGLRPFYPLERFKVSDRMEILVNLSSGNLVITQDDFTLKGTGQDLTISHVYNNLVPNSGSFGIGWTMSLGADVGLVVDGANVILHGPSNYCATYTPNANGGYTAPSGMNARLSKETDGTFTLVFDSSEDKWRFTAQGRLTSQADRNGNANTFNYNPNGTLASITDSQGRVTTVTTNAAGLVTRITDPTGSNVATYTYNDNNQLTSLVDRTGHTVTIGWDAGFNLTSITDPSGNAYCFHYDSSDRVTEVSVPNSAKALDTTFAYQSGQTVETDPNGHATTYQFDTQGRQTKAIDPLGHEQSRTWTANSDIQTTTDGLGSASENRYDPLNNLIGTKLPTGATNTVGYTSAPHPHSPTSLKDPAGREVTREYDTAGNLTKIHSVGLNADLDVRTYNSPKGTLATAKDGNGNTISFGYDPAGNLTSVTPPAPLGSSRFQYDSLSRIVQATDGRGQKIGYDYDAFDRVVRITDDSAGGKSLLAIWYDNQGNVIWKISPTWNIFFSWDRYPPFNEIKSAERSEGSSDENVTYGYDDAGNIDNLWTDQTGQPLLFYYDAANRLIKMTDPGIQDTTFTYDNADHRTSLTWPGAGSQTIGYDASGRQTSISVKNPGGVETFNATYSYTPAGGGDSDLLQSKTIAGVTTSMSYDPLGRLAKAGNDTFTYDLANNLTNLAGVNFTMNPANEFTQSGTSTNQFDGPGNLSGRTNPAETYVYSATNQLVGATSGGTETYRASYDGIDQTQPRSITETVGTTTSTHVFGQTALGPMWVKENGSTTTYSRDPRGTLVTVRADGGNRYNAITDYQGSILGLVDTHGALSATYTYSPYGQSAANGPAASATNLRYLGQYRTQRGDLLLGYRNYNPGWGRFTQPDPTGQERNPYNYGGNDPINRTDPTGGSQGAAIGGAIGSLIGLALVAGCPATAGIGCALAGSVMSGLVGGAGAALGSKLAGNTTNVVASDGLDGVTSGLFGGVAKVPGLKKLFE
jgi:RHS repeat-associated protein